MITTERKEKELEIISKIVPNFQGEIVDGGNSLGKEELLSCVLSRNGNDYSIYFIDKVIPWAKKFIIEQKNEDDDTK